MSIHEFSHRSRATFAMVGGWRTIAEAVVSRAVFLVVYLLTDRVLVSAFVAVGGVLALAIVQAGRSRKYWPAVISVSIVGLSALSAGGTGDGVGFYLPEIAINVAVGTVCGLSLLVGWPAVGLAVGLARGDRTGWRHDRAQRRRYQLCTALFLAKDTVATALAVPLFVTGHVIGLGIVCTLLGPPAIAACAWWSWRILSAVPARAVGDLRGADRRTAPDTGPGPVA